VRPSTDSRRRSAWPLWRAYSSIMWTRIQRRLGARPSGQVRRAGRSRPPSASASGAGAGHGGPPEREELLGAVRGGRVPLPVRVGGPVHRVPRGVPVPTVQPPAEPVVLHVGQVLEHPAQGHRRGADRRPQAGRVHAPGLPRQGRALVVEEAQEGGGLVGREGRLRAAVVVQLGHCPVLLVRSTAATYCIATTPLASAGGRGRSRGLRNPTDSFQGRRRSGVQGGREGSDATQDGGPRCPPS